MIEHFSNGEKITNADWKFIDKVMEKESLDLSLNEAIEMRFFDKFGADEQTDFEKEQKAIKKEKNAKVKITTDEIDDLFFNVVAIAFKEKDFKNKDFHLLVSDKYSNRQTPSRLKKMVEKGYLKDLGGSPKTYQVINEKKEG